MRLLIRVTLAGLSLLAASAGFAAYPETNHVRAVVKHYDGTVEFWDRSTLRTIPLREEMAFRLGENDELSITVEQTNPLLFTYKIEAGPSTDNTSYAAALKFAEVLKQVQALLPGGAGAGGENQLGGETTSAAVAVLVKAGFDAEFVRTFGDNIEKIRAASKGIPEMVRKSGVSWADARAVRTEVQGWTATLDQTEKQLDVIRKADQALYDFARATVVPPKKKDAAKENQLGGTNTDTDFENTGTRAGTSVGVTGKAAVTETVGGGGTGTSDALLIVFDYVARHAGEVGDAIDELRKFQKIAAEIGKPISKDKILASVQQDRSEILTVTAREEAGTAATKATPKAGTYKFLLRADTAVEYEFIEPAILYSLVEREDWDTKAVADGKFEIVRNDDGDEINGTTLAGMLSITPRALKDWSFAPSFQLGFSPVKDRFGIFGGLSFRVFDLFKFGAGVAYQQTEKLSSSQHAGKLLSTADELDLEIEPDTGFYFGLTLDLGKKNK